MQKALEIQSGNLTLRGMFHIPENEHGRYPVVVMYHGFTGHKAESHFIFVKLSRALEKAGIASLRFDFGGSGESDGEFHDMTPDTEIMDAKAILNFARSQEFVDPERVGILGLSMGGYIGGITAGDNKNLVRSLCMWAPAGNIAGIFKSKMECGIEVKEDIYDIGDFLLNEKAYDSAKSIDHIKRTCNFDKKACIIHGTADMCVPIEIGIQYKNAMDDVEFYSVEGSDHTFARYDWERKAIDTTVDFFVRTLAD